MLRLGKIWLYVAAVVVGCFGPVFALGAAAGWTEPARLSLDILGWPIDGAQTYAEPTTRFLSALAGGFLVGWGVTIALMTHHLYDLAPEAVRRCAVGGLLSWFVVDSLGSVAAGQPANALFNVLVLLLAVGPLWRPLR